MAPVSVLVIDDSETDLLFTQIMLERAVAPLKVTAMESASQALDLLAADPAATPDLILLDLNMPGMNGFEFLSEYGRLWSSRPHPAPVVVLSSSPLDLDRERALSHDCVRDYITKPLSPAAIERLGPWLRH